MFFLHAKLKRLGNKSIGACPINQGDCQKLALAPFPSVTIVLARKSCLSIALTGGGEVYIVISQSRDRDDHDTRERSKAEERGIWEEKQNTEEERERDTRKLIHFIHAETRQSHGFI